MNRHDFVSEERDSAMSAMADGELRLEDLASTVGSCARDGKAHSRWDCYHLIGEVLRGADCASVQPASVFAVSTMQRIAAQDGHHPLGLRSTPESLPARASDTAPAAANDAFRWKLLAGCASLAAFTLIAWATLGIGTFSREGATVASLARARQAEVSVDTAASSADQPDQPDQQDRSVLRNAELDQYLAAHGQVVGGSALQMSGSFLRNASFSASADAK